MNLTLSLMSERYTITRRERKGNYFYTVNWSPYYRMEKYLIRNRVPAESGVYQIYHRESYNLVLLETNLAYYGGVRGTFSELVDPLSPRRYPFRDILLDGECYGRFALSPHKAFLEDVRTYLIHGELKDRQEEEIFVDEKDTLGIVRLDEGKKAPVQDDRKISFFVGYDVNKYNQGK